MSLGLVITIPKDPCTDMSEMCSISPLVSFCPFSCLVSLDLVHII